MNENKKGVRAPKRTKKAKGLEIAASKPRNFVAKNALGGGAGAHKDKKKAMKQGDVKHKKTSSYFEHLETMFESALRDRDDYESKRKALDDLGRTKGVDQKAVQQRRLDLDKEAKKKGVKEATINEEGLSPQKRLQIIRFIAHIKGWGISDLELASDPELIDIYKKIKAEQDLDEARANTAGVRAGLAKRNKKPLSPEEQAAKDKAKSDKWLEKERAKQQAKEGWTHDTLAAQLFDHVEDDPYTDRLQSMLEGKVAFMEATGQNAKRKRK